MASPLISRWTQSTEEQKMRGAEKELTPADSAQLSHLLNGLIPEIMGRNCQKRPWQRRYEQRDLGDVQFCCR